MGALELVPMLAAAVAGPAVVGAVSTTPPNTDS